LSTVFKRNFRIFLPYLYRRKILRVTGDQLIPAAVPFPFKNGSSAFRSVDVAKYTGLHSVFVNDLFENGIFFR
jgi:hypothetical protein